MQLSPIVLFVYNRPRHTQRTLDALAANDEARSSRLYIYCDGPKESADAAQLTKINDVRAICRTEDRFGEIHLVMRDTNHGLAPSIISGVTEVVNRHGTVIVLEDDIHTSKHFLRFMNAALSMYETDSKVIGIGACNYFALGSKIPPTFFLPVPDCLGWATWVTRWALFEPDGRQLLSAIRRKRQTEKFNLYGFFNFSAMLEDHIGAKVSSWAVRWQAVAYLNDMIALYPNPSLTQHIASAEGTHAAGVSITPPLAEHPIALMKVALVVQARCYYQMMKGYYTYFDKNPIRKAQKRYRLAAFWKGNKDRIISDSNLVA
jgi:hypothetical protein